VVRYPCLTLTRLGTIQSYCQHNVSSGLSLLKMASSLGYTRASYVLGLALRDSQGAEATAYMKKAADAGYLPALQEVLPAGEMKAKYGESNAGELRRHLDHLNLNRLLARHYVCSPGLRSINTSHCWNPLCGRWAFKATMIGTSLSGESSISRPMPDDRHGPGVDFHPRLDSASKFRMSRMKMCSRCCRAKYCSKLCQVYDWRSGRHKMECQYL